MSSERSGAKILVDGLIDQGVLTAEASNGLLVEHDCLCPCGPAVNIGIKLSQAFGDGQAKGGQICVIPVQDEPHHSFAFVRSFLHSLVCPQERRPAHGRYSTEGDATGPDLGPDHG